MYNPNIAYRRKTHIVMAVHVSTFVLGSVSGVFAVFLEVDIWSCSDVLLVI